ncbi:hypothetical protein GLYMA_09G115700v4 [Glycine max]|uniref:Uncharacterized protein n=1 Tax=Glycine max TaxID=3847 RepID=A0A0R0I734_SOYBN|nr:hypothetical protein JHK87_024729 [Glycine soja]KAH1042589.1 hypothetical protein GYH30_024743 [Glycine max]KRH38166.1 hypothetical protein GLYMA_09G115700v4 [Glycine max]
MVDLNLDDFGFFLDTDVDGLVESLGEGFGFPHLEGEDFASGDHGERGFELEGLGHAHGNGGLAGAGLADQEDCVAGNFSVFDHLS